VAVFPGSPPASKYVKVELNLAGSWTDITSYVQHRSAVAIQNMGRADEQSSIAASQLTLTLKNDGRFTPKNASGAYYPNILRNTQIRVSFNATSVAPLGTADGTFETGVASWTPASATFAQSSAQAHGGRFSGLLTVTGTPSQAFVRPALAASAPVTAGTSYTASGWLYSAAGYGNAGFAIDWYTSGGAYLSTSSGTTAAIAAGTWQFYQVTGTAPATAAFGEYGPTIGGNPPAGTAVFLDDAAMVPAVNFYAGYRFHGEISSWPPAWDASQRDTYVTITASGIWRRIRQAQAPIGSPCSRYVKGLTGTSVPATWWAMEDGNDSTAFVTGVGAGAAAAITGTPSFAADTVSFPGSDALPQFNGARVTANVSSAATPTNTVVRFAFSAPATGEGYGGGTYTGGGELCKVLSPSATVKRYDISLVGNQLKLSAYTSTSGGATTFTGTITTKVNGTPVLVSLEITPSGGSVNWALKIIKPGAGAVLDSVSGTRATSAIAAVTQVVLNGQGRIFDSAAGQLGVWYAVPSLTTAAAALGGYAGEFAVDRFTRLCGEFGIATSVIGSASAAMGPQPDDTLANVLQQIEDTDGGLLYETRDQFGLGYRTLGSLQDQAVAVTLNQAAGVLGDTPQPTYDDQLIRNQITVTNTDGYAALAQLTSGAISIQAVPNGVGVYAGTASTNASSHSQVNAIAQQKLFQGCTDEVRYPTVVMQMARAQAGPLFSPVPALRPGDYLQLTNMPSFAGGGTSKQLAWGYSETIGHNSWVITFNTIPELPFETTFSPGVYSVTQAPAAGVAQGSTVGGSGSISAGQIGSGAALPATISARTIGGTTSFISAATPYDWSFSVSGVPADVTYFICTEDQALPISAGDTFSSTSGLGGPFTVTSVDPPSGGNVTVHYTPDATSVMSTGTVQGGKEGDTWVNTSGGNQVNLWHNGAWSPVTWTASSVIAASSVTSGLLAAGSVIAGTIAAGAIDGMTISGAQFIAYGSNGQILIYSGTPALGNLIGSDSAANYTDSYGNLALAGRTSYYLSGGTYFAVSVYQGSIIVSTASAAGGPYTQQSSLIGSTAGRMLLQTPAGYSAPLSSSQADNTPATTTASGFTRMSKNWTIPANDAQAGTLYRVTAWGDGHTASTSGTLSVLNMNLSGGNAQATYPTASQGTNLNLFWRAEGSLLIGTTGPSGSGTFNLSFHISSGGSGGYSACGDATAVAYDTTISNTFAVFAGWGTGSVTAQTLTCRGSLFERLGN
jgi:hypothetical protein